MKLHLTHRRAFGMILVLAAAYHFVTLDRYPIFWNDEALYAEAGVTCVRNGVPGLPSVGEAYGLADRSVSHGFLHSFLIGTADRLAGPSVRALRMTAFVCGLASLAALYALGVVVGSPWAGVLATAWFAVGDDFLRFTHETRPDMMVMAMGLWAIVFLARAAEEDRPRWLIWAGVLLGVALEVHLIVGVWIFGAGVVALIRFRWRAWGLAAGIIPGAVLWLTLHVLVDPAFFAYQWTEYWSVHVPPPFPFSSLGSRLDLLWNTIMTYFWARDYHYKVPLGIVLVLSLLGGFLSKAGKDRLVAGVVAGQWAFYILASRQYAYYLFMMMPLSLFLGARILERAKGAGWPKAGAVVAAAAALFAVYYGTATVAAHVKYRNHDQSRYFDYVSHVRDIIPEGKAVFGPVSMGYGLAPHYRYTSTCLLVTVELEDGRRRYGSEFGEILDRLGVEYVVLERQTEWVLQKFTGECWLEVVGRWEEVGAFDHRYYGGEGMGFGLGNPRKTRIMRVPRK